MTTVRKEKLVALGADQLADALLGLASYDDAADDLVERMIATPQENIQRFKGKLSEIKRNRRFIPYGASAAFALELSSLLQDIEAGVTDPLTGAELVASFYECDGGALGNCDDSSGSVGDVFRHDARELFVGYASRCTEKEWLGNLVFKVIQCDDYGAVSVSDWCGIAPHAVYKDAVRKQHARKSSFWSRYQRDAKGS